MARKTIAKKTAPKKPAATNKVANKVQNVKEAVKSEEKKVETVVKPVKKVETVTPEVVKEINYLEYLGSSHIKVVNNEEKKTASKYPITVALKNYDIEKTVKVIYTEDNWETIEGQDLEFVSQDDNNIEIWNASLKLNAKNKDAFQYAVCYTCNGNDIWDNNNGENYCF